METPKLGTIKEGDVFQITEAHGRKGWIGAFVLTTDVYNWGIMGFVHVIDTHESSGFAYIRLPWEQIDYIGKAVMIPKPDDEEQNEKQ